LRAGTLLRDDSIRRDDRFAWTYSPENTVIAVSGH
jgi:hypothetical protein